MIKTVFVTSNGNISLRISDISFMVEKDLWVCMASGKVIELETKEDFDELKRLFEFSD